MVAHFVRDQTAKERPRWGWLCGGRSGQRWRQVRGDKRVPQDRFSLFRSPSVFEEIYTKTSVSSFKRSGFVSSYMSMRSGTLYIYPFSPLQTFTLPPRNLLPPPHPQGCDRRWRGSLCVRPLSRGCAGAAPKSEGTDERTRWRLRRRRRGERRRSAEERDARTSHGAVAAAESHQPGASGTLLNLLCLCAFSSDSFCRKLILGLCLPAPRQRPEVASAPRLLMIFARTLFAVAVRLGCPSGCTVRRDHASSGGHRFVPRNPTSARQGSGSQGRRRRHRGQNRHRHRHRHRHRQRSHCHTCHD